MAKDPTPSSAMPTPMQAHERLVADALLLRDFVIGTGFKTADGHQIANDIITTIESAATKLGLFDGKPAGAASLSEDDWAELDLAYYDLAATLAPVTAETLRATAGAHPGSRTWAEYFWGDSPALRFTRKLWFGTLGLAIVVVGANWYLTVIAMNPNTNEHMWDRPLLELLTPWLYGALGACVYLLRSAHMYIYQRTFDVRRKPEYTNRIMLGAIAGGAIIMFANNIIGDDGSVIQLSSAALGFLAGYNTDLLFSAMERVTNALLPKIGLDTVQRGPASAATKPIDFNDLAERHDKATGADKEHYKKIMSKLVGAHAVHKNGKK